mmetsp:Transcript_22142/g.34057  ORF Transcript_22142/g.34057 Transcript_22142/m.34057 type:complete len:284 (-) Transcript_22142:631-1482(-)
MLARKTIFLVWVFLWNAAANAARLGSNSHHRQDMETTSENSTCTCDDFCPSDLQGDGDRKLQFSLPYGGYGCPLRPIITPAPCPGWEAPRAFCHYWFGFGKEITLDKTGLTEVVTDWWKNDKNWNDKKRDRTLLEEITKYVCEGGTAPEDWGVSRPPKSACNYWIGGHTLFLTAIKDLGVCPKCCSHNYELTLTMRDSFSTPAETIGVTCEFGIPFDVTHTWKIEISCPGTCPPTPAPSTLAPIPLPSTSPHTPRNHPPSTHSYPSAVNETHTESIRYEQGDY